MYVDPLKARLEQERLERERQARIKAEKDRQAKIKAEKDRQAKLKAERDRQAKLKAERDEAKKGQKTEHPDKKPSSQKPDNKKPQSDKKPDSKDKPGIVWGQSGQISPLYGSSSPIHNAISPVYGQPSVPIAKSSEPKPEVPIDRQARTWKGEEAKPEPTPEPKSEPKPYKPRDLSGIKRLAAEDIASREQKKQEQLQNTLKQEPGVSELLRQPSFFNGALTFGTGLSQSGLGTTSMSGSKGLGQTEKPKQPEAEKEVKPSGGGFFQGALSFGTSLVGDIVNVGKTVLESGETAVATIAKTIPQPLLSLTNPALMATSVLTGAGVIAANATQPKEEGGWFGKAMSFGNTLVSGAKSLGQSALDLGSNAYNGAANWVSDHKAEIAIGVGIAALAAATILTGGAALAVAGAVAGTGAAVSAGTVATVVAGGVVAGAGLNLAQQGAQIKDGVIDPATGQKKTDINFGDVAKSGAVGGVMAPVGAAAFGLAPVVVGGLGLVGVGQGVKSGVENVQQGNNWSAALDFGTAALAAAPFATKGGRSAMFGADARARTALTAGQVWTGARNLPNRALNAADQVGYGARVLASELSPNVVTPEGLIGRPPMPEAPTPRPLIPAPQKQQPLRMQGNNPEGLQGAGGTTATQERRGVLETSEPQVATPTHTPESQPVPGSRTGSEPVPTYETPYQPLTPKQRKILKAKVEDRTISQDEYNRLQWDRRFSNRRQRGVDRFWGAERRRLRAGDSGTRNWTPEQKAEILAGRTPTHNGKPIEGHHTYNALDHPQIADDGNNIYPATWDEHFHRWHGGNFQNDTFGEPFNPSHPEDF